MISTCIFSQQHTRRIGFSHMKELWNVRYDVLFPFLGPPNLSQDQQLDVMCPRLTHARRAAVVAAGEPTLTNEIMAGST